eukprot:TRINITY_DN10778_c0_g1_i2.p1 TRINITY_DN10778_c0_g1~~TRINITY_DN10778_c0_g1_i2.p1  ORF type:complete len:400 (+),score=95.13 TRINITY_DN10778_c0_g1_i2:104-1303(+)
MSSPARSPGRLTRKQELRVDDKLFQACKEGNEEDVTSAIEEGARVEHQGGVFDETGLHVACARGHLNVVKTLVEAGACVHARCERNNTPLHEAAFSNHLHVVKWLVKNTKTRLRARNQANATPQALARTQKHNKIYDYLKKAAETRRASPRRAGSPSPSLQPTADLKFAKKVGKWFATTLGNDATWDDVRAQHAFLQKLLKPLSSICERSGGLHGPVGAEDLLPSIIPGLDVGDVPDMVPSISVHQDTQAAKEGHEAREDISEGEVEVSDVQSSREGSPNSNVEKTEQTKEADIPEPERPQQKDETPLPATDSPTAAANPPPESREPEVAPEPKTPEFVPEPEVETPPIEPPAPVTEAVPTPLPNEAAPPAPEWECSVCLYANLAGDAICQVCDTPYSE